MHHTFTDYPYKGFACISRAIRSSKGLNRRKHTLGYIQNVRICMLIYSLPNNFIIINLFRNKLRLRAHLVSGLRHLSALSKDAGGITR